MKKTSKNQQADSEEPLHQLCKAVASVKNAEEAKRFLQDICTPAELQAIADRWHVVEPLKQNTPYRKIYDATGVSVTTIGRVARFISHGNGGYDLIYNRVKSKRHAKQSTAQHSPTKKREVK